MNPLIVDVASALVRAALIWIAAKLTASGMFDASLAARITDPTVATGIAVGAGALIWSIWQKYNSRKKLVTALSMPEGSTEHQVEQAIKSGVSLPAASTPKDVAPEAPTVAVADAPRPSNWPIPPVPPAAVLLLVLLLPGVAHAQVGDQSSAWQPSNRPIADAISTAAVAGQAGAAAFVAVKDWRAGNHKTAWRTLCAGGIATGASEGIKAFVREPRPNGLDEKSFPSEHSALSAALSGWSFTFGVPLAVGVGMLRIDANWHHPKDVAAGWGIGAGAQALCSALIR